MSKQALACADCTVRRHAICAHLASQELARLKAISHLKVLRAGDLIVDENCKPEYCAIVLRGVIKLIKGFSDGRQQIVGLLLPSDFLGRLFGKAAYRAEAESDVELCAFPTSRLERLLREDAVLEHLFLQQALDELDAARDWMAVLGRKTAAERIASFLLLLIRRAARSGARRERNGTASGYDLPLRRRDVADYLGLRNETVSRQMSLLKDRGIIDVCDGGKSFIVLNLPLLQACAEQSCAN